MSTRMWFQHSPVIWREFPALVAGALVAVDIRPAVELGPALEPWYARARERLAGRAESELAEVSAWRRAYTQMGLKPTQYRSAAEALLRRFRREGSLPRVHPLVDLANAMSLAWALPVAVFDLDRVDGHLEVRHAQGDERHLGFGGEIEAPEPGEVVFADAAGHAHARRWTFRQSRRSTVSPETRRVLIVSEGLHPAAGADVPALLAALAAEISAVWDPPRATAVLGPACPRLEFPVDR